MAAPVREANGRTVLSRQNAEIKAQENFALGNARLKRRVGISPDFDNQIKATGG